MTQTERIRAYIESHGSITPIEATTYLGVIDLSRTISYMRKHGHEDIIGVRENGVNRFGDKVSYNRYSICQKGEE